eukprot:3549292-Amphidinium_carterae.1
MQHGTFESSYRDATSSKNAPTNSFFGRRKLTPTNAVRVRGWPAHRWAGLRSLPLRPRQIKQVHWLQVGDNTSNAHWGCTPFMLRLQLAADPGRLTPRHAHLRMQGRMKRVLHKRCTS